MYNGQRGHGGGDRGFGGGHRGFGDKPSFKATCASCGNECEVPFKPNGSRPIYCRDCFKKEDSFGGGNRFENGPSVRTSFVDRPMFQATCASCGGRCEVPFRPSGDKPIYCKACFGGRNSKPTAPSADYGPQIKAINEKLDLILKALNLTAPAKVEAKPVEKVDEKLSVDDKPAKKEKPAKAEKAEKPEKKPAKKAAAKKAKK